MRKAMVASMFGMVCFADELPLKLWRVARFYTNVLNTNQASNRSQRSKILHKYDFWSCIYCDMRDEQ